MEEHILRRLYQQIKWKMVKIRWEEITKKVTNGECMDTYLNQSPPCLQHLPTDQSQHSLQISIQTLTNQTTGNKSDEPHFQNLLTDQSQHSLQSSTHTMTNQTTGNNKSECRAEVMTQRCRYWGYYDHETCWDCTSRSHLSGRLPATLWGSFHGGTFPSVRRQTRGSGTAVQPTVPASVGRTMSDSPGNTYKLCTKPNTVKSTYKEPTYILLIYLHDIYGKANVKTKKVYFPVKLVNFCC